MNYSRLALTVAAAVVVDFVYGFVVYGNLLTGEFERYPAIFRPMDVQMAYMPYLAAGIVLTMIAASVMYAKGYEGRGGGVAEGIRFGLWVGLFVVGYAVVISYATMNIGRKLTGLMAIAGLAEWAVVGATIGAVYKASAAGSASTARSAGV